MHDLTVGLKVNTIATVAGAAMLTLMALPAVAGPVVVELYTSQGCNTCPPADEFLGELKERDDILPLSIHVNYWDYLGWRDPYATEDGTQRQHTYARPLGQRFIYTPQMVFDGRYHAAGHRRAEVEAAIRAAKAENASDLELTFHGDPDGDMTVSLPASDFVGEAEVSMMLYDESHTTEIRRGENAGRSLTYYNVVREIEPLGRYTGAAVTIELPMADGGDNRRDGCAVIVQVTGLGPIIGAGKIELAN